MFAVNMSKLEVVLHVRIGISILVINLKLLPLLGTLVFQFIIFFSDHRNRA